MIGEFKTRIRNIAHIRIKRALVRFFAISNFAFLLTGTDTIYSETGQLDTILIENLPAGTYDFYVYDSIPDGLYGIYDCAVFQQITITQPQDTLSVSVNLLSNVEIPPFKIESVTPQTVPAASNHVTK